MGNKQKQLMHSNNNSNSSKATIRLACVEDVPALTRLSEELGYAAREDDIANRLMELINDNEHIIYTAVLPTGHVVGWIHGIIRKLLIVPAHIELGGLVVQNGYQGQGIGTKLLNAVEKWGSLHGIKTIFVRSNEIRKKAHHFYQKHGYQIIKKSLSFTKEL